MTDVDKPETAGPAGPEDETEANYRTEAAATKAELAVAPELVANSLGEYRRGALLRVRAGESGMLPVIAGLLLISILFQSLNSKFLTAGNLVNLLIQGAAYMLLAMGEIFALLLGEIDLSIGFVAGIGGPVMPGLLNAGFRFSSWVGV